MKRFLMLFLVVFPGLLLAQNKLFLDSLQIELNDAKEDSDKIRILWKLYDYHAKSDLSKSLEYGLEALETAKQTKNPLLVATSHTYLLNFFFQTGNFSAALKNGLDALKIYEELGKEDYLLKIYQNLGVVFDQMKEYDKSLEYYFMALSIYNKTASDKKPELTGKMAMIYNCIGGVYEVKNDYDTAQQYFTKALEIAKEIQDDGYLGMIYNNLGKLSMNMGKEDEALKYFQLSLEHREKINDLNGMARTYLFEGIYFMDIGEYDKALEIAEKAKELTEKVGRKGLRLDLEWLFFRIYQAQKKPQKALDAHVRYKQLSDSLRSEANLKEQIALQLQYEYEKKEKIREAEQEKLKFQYGLIISILTLGFIITGLLYRLAKNRTKRISLENKSLEKDLEIKNKELTTNVMYLLKKNELIESISKRLLLLKARMKQENQETAQRIIFDLQAGADQDVWEEFELRFQQVHNDFYEKLQAQFPDLTPSEVKLCAFLRLNMTSKEIAAITHQSVKGIEVVRAKIRKKLNLTGTDVNLISFLAEL